ncbi:hypothetical protein [Rhodococcus sp. 114MFTsu3.1]|uniref:hypothetical protein n=1 Tax=Rhodococcus sp. 114MFTsu3.1 TaxID=1172184 RepID=UPI000376688E|nr:hypothetical protein [Rhodococcus sp. 114MFTsu3.1]
MSLQTDIAKLQRERRTLEQMTSRVNSRIRDRVRIAAAAGASWTEIAQACGISKARVGQLLKD